jgi:nucleoside-diphosphate-sugar epimerase
MKIFVAGAAGVIGTYLVPALVAAGHDVVGTTRDAAKSEKVRALGAEPVVLDALDRDAVRAAVAEARPDVVIHQLTAIGATDFKKFDESYELTNQLRTKGVDYLLEAAIAAGAKRFIAQSFTGWPNARTGSEIKTEDDPLDPDPVPAMRETIAATIASTAKAGTARPVIIAASAEPPHTAPPIARTVAAAASTRVVSALEVFGRAGGGITCRRSCGCRCRRAWSRCRTTS